MDKGHSTTDGAEGTTAPQTPTPPLIDTTDAQQVTLTYLLADLAKYGPNGAREELTRQSMAGLYGSQLDKFKELAEKHGLNQSQYEAIVYSYQIELEKFMTDFVQKMQRENPNFPNIAAYIREIADAAADPNWKPAEPPPQKYTAISAQKIVYPVDKINREIYDWEQEGITLRVKDGKAQIPILTNGKDDTAKVIVTVDFRELTDGKEIQIEENLTRFDELLQIVVYTFCKIAIENGAETAGSSIDVCTTIPQILQAMRGIAKPAKNQTQRVYDSLKKMLYTQLIIDNRRELTANKSYKGFYYKGPVLSWYEAPAIINGQFVKNAIHFTTVPAMMRFAAARGQITTISTGALAIKGQMTEPNLKVEFYIRDRVIYMNSHPKESKVILFESLFEKCHFKEWRQKKRAILAAIQTLDTLKGIDTISAYSLDIDRFTIGKRQSVAKRKETEKELKLDARYWTGYPKNDG